MSYDYQTDDMDALRITFEDMMFEIESLKANLDDADVAIVELFDEANELEAQVHKLKDQLICLREKYDQDMFDAANEYELEIRTLEDHLDRVREEYEQVIFDQQEDYVELERSYNILAEQYVDLHDWLMDDDFVGVLFNN